MLAVDVTRRLKFLSVTSHLSIALPSPVVDLLTQMAEALDEGLQAEGHNVGTAMTVHSSFDEGYIASPLRRGLVSGIVRGVGIPGLRFRAVGNGGCEVHNVHEDVVRRFRLKSAKRDVDGRIDVRVGTDSILTHRARAATLFDTSEPEQGTMFPADEIWLLPYMVSPVTWTLNEMYVGLPVGTVNEHPPFRLVLDHVVRLHHLTPPPPSFRATSEDLDLGEAAGDASAGTGSAA